VKAPQFQIGIKNNVTADSGDGVCELYFLDRIQNPIAYDWNSGLVEEQSLLGEVISQVKYYSPKKIIQHIDSGGGSADVGFGIYNYTKNVGCKVETKILNMCGSIATVMAFSGTKITMPRNGLYVIHQASNVGIGTAKDLREAAELADKYTEMMLDVYVQNNRKGKTRDEIYALIENGDYWMTGLEAKEMGFVDDTYNDEAVTVTASINAAKQVYANIPQHILDLQESEPTNNESLFTKINKEMKNLKELVTAAIEGISKNKVDTKSANISADIAEAIAQPLNDMVEGMQAEVTAEIGSIKEKVTAELTASITDGVTASVTAAFEAKYGQTIADLQKNVTDLTADLEKQVGKPSGTETAPAAPGKKSLAGGRFND